MINSNRAETLFSTREIAEKLFPKEGERHPDDLRAPLTEPEVMSFPDETQEEPLENPYAEEQDDEEDHHGGEQDHHVKKTKRSSEKARLRKKEAEMRSQDLERQLEETRQKLVVEREANLNKTRLLLEKEKNELDIYEGMAKTRFAKALESGDGRAAADIQSDMTSIAQAKTKLDEYENYVNSFAHEEVPSLPQGQEAPTEASQNYQHWLEENSWYNSNAQMQGIADQISVQLDAQLRLNGREDLIYSPEFFNAITKSVREHYGIGEADDAPQGQRAPQAPSQGARPHYSTVSRKTSVASSRGGPSYPKLPQEAHEFAMNLPDRRNPDGSFMTRQAIYSDFAKEYWQYQNNPQQNNKGR